MKKGIVAIYGQAAAAVGRHKNRPPRKQSMSRKRRATLELR